MTKNLTLKRLLKRHKEHPEDAGLHKLIERGKSDEKEFDKLVKKGTEEKAYDKKK
jgi:hypothetical protein